ncbi:MAG: hypothetical protein JW838_16110, partial [Spirochaetes bacterium]|nr:hypothetical protein [Spirochaetota bacterium]
MTIALVSLGVSRKDYPYLLNWLYMTPPGIHYARHVLEGAGFGTTVIDKVDENLTTAEVIDRLREIRPDAVLCNQFFSTRHDVKEICEALPEDAVRGIGGQDATFHSISLSDGEFAERYSHADFVWQGECEKGLSEFLLSFRRGEGPVRVDNLSRRVTDLDELPILDHDDYSGEIAFLVTSRGCVSNGCDFCTTPRFYPDGWRARSVAHVAGELGRIRETGRVHVNVTDDNFLGLTEQDLDRGIQIIAKARDVGMKLYPMTSVRQVLRAGERGILPEWTGTVPKIFLGVENTVPSALRAIGKKVHAARHADECARAMDLLYEHGISPYLGYINFNPETTSDELEESAGFLHRNNSEASNFHYLYNNLGIYEGTRLFDRYKEERLEMTISGSDYRYTFRHRETSVAFAALTFVMDRTQILDFLHFEATHLV